VIFLNHSPPPAEGLPSYHAARITAERSATDFLGRFIYIAHHQEQQVARAEGITFPCSLDWKRSLASINVRELAVLARRVNPFSPPPGLWLIETAAVVITAYVVDLRTTMPLQNAELPHDLFAFRVLGSALLPRHIAQIKRDIPIKSCGGF
jgi:hypothetical protein